MVAVRETDLADRVAAAVAALGSLGERDAPLAPLTTYRIGGSAAVLARPHSLADLHCVAVAVTASELPVLVVGRGSNLLVADDGFAGIAVALTALADITVSKGDGIVSAGGGVSLPVLARRTAAASLTGFEWAVGVPGSIGGAVRMNAGGHGSDIAAALIDVQLVDLASGSADPVTTPATELGLRFRGSDLRDEQVVVGARLALGPGERTRSEAEIAEIVRWRREHQPGGQNAGSVFVNPVPGEVSAGSLVDGLGLRGLRVGTAYVSDKHANFIQASEGGRATDVRALMELVRARVAEATGHHLRSEVRLVGFGGDATTGGGEQ